MVKKNLEKKNSFYRRGCLTSLILFLAFFLIIGVNSSRGLSDSKNLVVSVELREWLMLEVSTSSEHLKSEGTSSCSVAGTLNVEDNPVNIRALVCVPKNQVVQLHVQALGDLLGQGGETIPISNVAWRSIGTGFSDGILGKGTPQVMASWIGPGFYNGSINYFFLDNLNPKESYSQTIIYSLIIP